MKRNLVTIVVGMSIVPLFYFGLYLPEIDRKEKGRIRAARTLLQYYLKECREQKEDDSCQRFESILISFRERDDHSEYRRELLAAFLRSECAAAPESAEQEAVIDWFFDNRDECPLVEGR